jgi:hypothetical protein
VGILVATKNPCQFTSDLTTMFYLHLHTSRSTIAVGVICLKVVILSFEFGVFGSVKKGLQIAEKRGSLGRTSVCISGRRKKCFGARTGTRKHGRRQKTEVPLSPWSSRYTI